MFCKKCGNETPDDLAFCNSCGANLSEEVEATEEVAENEQPAVEEAIADEQPAVEEAPAFAEPDFTTPTGKSKKKLLAVLIPVLAVILATSIAVGAFFDPIKDFIANTFSSPAAYFELVETKAINSFTEDALDAYETMISNTEYKDTAANASLKFSISDGILSMLEEALYYETGTNLDLSWLNEISIDFDVNLKDKVEQIFAGININGKELVGADVIFDMVKGEFFMAVPLLNESYVHIDSDSLYDLGIDTSALTSSYENAILTALPSKNDAAALINEFAGIVIGNVDNVTKSEETIVVSGIEQSVTVLEATLDEKTVENIALDVLKALKDNNTIKTTVNNMADVLVEQGMLTEDDANEVYDNFVESINEAIDDIKESGVDEDVVLTIIDYVNSKNEIIGRKIIADGQEVLYYATAANGNDIGFELNFDTIKVVGNGTNKNDVLNGEYAVMYLDTKVCDLYVSDFKADTDTVNGSIKLVPSASIIKELFGDGDVSSAISLLGPALEFNFKSDDNSGEFAVNLLSNGSALFGITVSATEKSPSAVNTPNPSDCYSLEEIEQWASEIDLLAIYDRLLEVLPEEFTNSFLGLLM